MGRARVNAMALIEEAARRGLFRERDLRKRGVWHSAFADAELRGLVTSHGHGVWSHCRYKPTRYELLQIRFPRAVFWGPSALWLHGEEDEPEALWIAITNKSRAPRTLELSTVIIRTRNLEQAVTSVTPEGTWLTLRVHTPERAQADIARTDCHRLLERAVRRAHFVVPREASFLSARLPPVQWHQIPAFREDWVVEQSLGQPK